MKKKIIIIASIVVVIALGVVLYNSLFNTPYTEIIESIWNIDLPEAGAKEIYSYSEPSFHGDGIRYHVIDYPIGNEKYQIPFGQYALHIISDVPVCACFGRLDVRQDNMAYYSLSGYSF